MPEPNDNPYLKIYKLYHSEYWHYKLRMLATILARFDEIEQPLTERIENYEKNLFQRLLRQEIHFTYFQILEALFSIIFAIKDAKDEFLWPELTFGKWQGYNDRIKDIQTGKSMLFSDSIEFTDGSKKLFFEWLLFFGYEPITDIEKRENYLKLVRKFLKVFASDWGDHEEYNAYKHGLRLFHDPHELMIGVQGKKEITSIGKVDDASTYLEGKLERDKQGKKSKRIYETSKPYNPIRDYRLADVAYRIISNIFTLRRKYYFSDNGIYFDLSDVDFDEAIKSSLPLGKSSFSIT